MTAEQLQTALLRERVPLPTERQPHAFYAALYAASRARAAAAAVAAMGGDEDAFDFGGARRFAASNSSDECGPAAARTSAAVSAESSRGRRVWLTGLRAVRSTAKEPFHCLRSSVGGKVVGIVS